MHLEDSPEVNVWWMSDSLLYKYAPKRLSGHTARHISSPACQYSSLVIGRRKLTLEEQGE